MKKNFTILFAVLLICMCSLVVLATGDGVYNLECGTVGDDLQVYVTNNGSEDVVISPVFASFDADGRLYNSKVWLNVTIPAGENVGFDLTDRFDETRLNKLFFFDSELCPIREAEELVAKDDDIIFDTDDLFKLNPRVVRSMDLAAVNARLAERGERKITAAFWAAVMAVRAWVRAESMFISATARSRAAVSSME